MNSFKFLIVAGLAFICGAGFSSAANVALNASDVGGTTSFNSGGHWNNGAAPSIGNSYFTTNFILRSPSNTTAYAFAGGSLSIDTGGRFLLKGTGGQILTITNLILNGGLMDYANFNTDNNTEIIAGNITLNAGTTSYFGALSGSASETLLVTAPINGSGNLQIAGASVNTGADNGAVIFSGNNSYTGNTLVTGGTLLINGPTGSSSIIVANGGTLGGTGSISGITTVQVGGKLAPGIPALGALTASLGTLTTSNTATLAGTTWMKINRATATKNDRLAGSVVVVSPGAILTVTNIGSTNFVTGDTFALFSSPISGSFTTLNLPALPSSTMTWTNKLAVDGTIAVVGGNLIGVGVASPSIVTTNQSTLLTVVVTPGANPASTGISVTANLNPIGSSASQVFYDDGTHGDLTAGDNVFSFSAMGSSNTVAGNFNLNVSVSDVQGRTTTTTIALTAVAPAGPFFSAPFLPLSSTNAAGSLPLVAAGQAVPIYYSRNDATVVGIAAAALRDDVQRVTGLIPVLSSNTPVAASNTVFIGTIGKSTLIDGLIAAGKINVAAIQGQWESYMAVIVTNPVAGVSRALVIVGNDRRGTAFGVFGLSEAIGVSPWYWWGDVPVTQRTAIYVGGGSYTEPAPGVKYRGIFLNDEDWGLLPWATSTFEPASGSIGPNTYAKVFELLLRLHANYIWPAMHTVTKAFYLFPQNKVVADNYAIVIGTSHHEPMERNTSEYDPNVLGAYNYWTNRAAISNFWDQRVLELTNYEDVYTIGMRGLTDDGIISPAGTTTQQKADELQNMIIPDQRAMIAKHLNPNPALVPQVFVPYKEALTLYQTGMQLADDITLVWPDDNHGYIRELSTTAENARSGGSGVYYHLSYWGTPANYLWLCTTPPGMTWEEMSKAWDYGASKLWIVNIGDLKPGEIGMEFFLRLARNPEAFRNFNQHAYLTGWAAQNFGSANADTIATLLDEYYRLNISVRPEHLNATSSGFNFFANGDEAQQRLDDFAALQHSADSLYAQLPANQRSAFYEMVLFPIRGANLLNQTVLLAERSRLWATQGRAATASLALAAQAAHNAILAETAFFNQTNANGKWNGMMTVNSSGAANAPYLMPTVGSYTAPAAAGLGVTVEGSVAVLASNASGMLPSFNPVAHKSYFIDVFNTGTSALFWTAQSSAPWITLTQTNGTADARIWVGVDWSKAPRGYAIPGTVTIQGAGVTNAVNVKAFYPLSLNLATLPAAVENNGAVTIEAENFTSSQDGTNGVGWRRLNRAAASRDGMTILPVTVASIAPAALTSDTPSLTYQFYTFSSGATVVQMACLPTHKITSDHVGCRYAISLNGDTPQVVDINADENSPAWHVNVLRATAYGSSNHTITNAGLQTLKVWMIDPGVVLDKLTININTGVFEAENLDQSISGPYHLFSEAGASGGGAISLDATAIGQYITFTLPNLAAGVLDLTVRVKAWNTRGLAQLSLGDAVSGPFNNIGSVLDWYTASAIYTNLAMVRLTNSTAGTKYLKFTVTGKNAASTGYVIVVDSFTFVPVSNAATPLQNWRMAYFGTMDNVGDAADAADSDHDGISNLLEYATGSYPTVSNGSLMTATVTNNHLTVTFTRAKDATDITTRVLADNSLFGLLSGGTEIWASATEPYPGGSAVSALVAVTDPQGTTNSSSRFLWLEVTKP